MKKLLAVFASLLLLTACSLPGTTPAVSKPTVAVRDGGPSTPKCAELEAQAASSPKVVVTGAWACLTPDMQNAFSALLQITSDQGLANYAATDPSFTHYYSCGQTEDHYYFDLRGNKKDPAMHYAIRMVVDPTSGLITNLQYAPGFTHSNTCP